MDVFGTGYDPCERIPSGLSILIRYGRHQTDFRTACHRAPRVRAGRLQGWSVAPQPLIKGALPTVAAHGADSSGTRLDILKSSSHGSAVYLLYGCTFDCLDCSAATAAVKDQAMMWPASALLRDDFPKASALRVDGVYVGVGSYWRS